MLTLVANYWISDNLSRFRASLPLLKNISFKNRKNEKSRRQSACPNVSLSLSSPIRFQLIWFVRCLFHVWSLRWIFSHSPCVYRHDLKIFFLFIISACWSVYLGVSWTFLKLAHADFPQLKSSSCCLPLIN